MKEFTYDPKTGSLYRGEKEAGYTNKHKSGHPYRRIYYKGKDLMVHRLVWEMHNGPIPKGMVIDHINGNGLDNRLENLRLATRSQNNRNRKLNANNTSGYKGVAYCFSRQGTPFKKPWRVWIQYDNKYYVKRGFATAEDAALHYNEKAAEFFGEFARLNDVQPITPR